MATIESEAQLLAPSALIELFVLDMTVVNAGKLYFHSGTNALSKPIVWQGIEYAPWPIEATGFDQNGQGSLPRPTLKAANVNGIFSANIYAYNDLLNCSLIRKRTFSRFLDAANFPDGNPEADPNQALPDEIWFIDKKKSENRYTVEFELASPFDLMGIQLPYRQVIKNSCPWRYRGPECGYTGPFMDKNNNVTSIAQDDTCPKLLQSCKARHGTYGDGTLPFGGFPGATRYDY